MIKKPLIFILLFITCSIDTDNTVGEIIIETTIASTSSTTTSTTTTSTTTTSTTTTSPSTTITTTTTTITIPKKIFISMDHPSEREDIPSSKEGYGDFIERLPGYEGDTIQNLEIRLAINELPDPFRTILKEEILVVNGCHPYGKVLFKRCVYGVFDPLGYDEEGNYGNDWSLSIWISDRGLQSGQLNDILLHEAAHAYSYLRLRTCKEPGGESYRNLAHRKFGGEENLADIFVYYFGGQWTNYIELEVLAIDYRRWVGEMIAYCNLYNLEKNT